VAIYIDWGNRIIHVPKADTKWIQTTPTEVRELDLNEFRLKLKSLEDDPDGMMFPDTHRHNTEVNVGGLVLARVIEIINGYTVTFGNGYYSVNLTKANSNIGDVVNANNVSIRSFNSAGMTSNPAIEYSSFNGGVSINVITGTTGTLYNRGTPGNPVNNVEDALLIAQYRGFDTLFINGNITFGTGHNIENLTVIGQNYSKTKITIETEALTNGTKFRDAYITGVLDGDTSIENCSIGPLVYVNGYIADSILGNYTIILGGTSDCNFLNCWSGVTNEESLPTIDFGGGGRKLGIRGYSGALKLINKTGIDKASIYFNSGELYIDSTVTNGIIDIKGICNIYNNSTATINKEDTLNTLEITTGIWSKSLTDYNDKGTAGHGMRKTLGLLHENIYIDMPEYDADNNLVSARVRIYSDPSSIGTDNNVLSTYSITSPSDGPGKFKYWKQMEV